MKKTNLLLMTALVVGLAACGGDDEAAAPVPYTPGSYYPIPQDPSAGAFASTEQWMIANLQGMFGNLTTNKNAILGNQTLPTGTHSWQTLLDIVKAAAENCGNYCQIQTYGYGSYSPYDYYSPLARTDFNRLRNYLNFSALRNVTVRYANDPGYSGYSLAHSVDQILKILQSSYSQMFTQWYGQGYYPVQYQPWYSGSGLSLGLNYNSNYGLQLGFGFSTGY